MNETTITPTIPEDVAKELETSISEVTKEDSLVITTDEEQTRANELLSSIKKSQKKIQTEEDKIKRPLLDATTAARELFKPFRQRLEAQESVIKKALIDYHRKQREEAEKKQEKIVSRVGSGRGHLKESTAIRQLSEVEAPKTNMETSAGSVNIKMVKELNLVDEAKIPRKYLVPDMAAIRKDAFKIYDLQKSGMTVEQIPGIEVRETESVAAR
jgi:ATP-dependent protease HslVU (ClpYQ) peptidase subunit